MKTRILSHVATRGLTFTAVAISLTIIADDASGQDGVPAQTRPGYYTDPNTGIIYRQVERMIERPVYETKMQSREQTVYVPQTVHETRPETRTVYTPITESVWQPRMTGRWNPFQQPSIAYDQVPQTRWEARNEVVQRTQSRTHWIAEKRNVDVPQSIVRMESERRLEYEAVGHVAVPPVDTTGLNPAIAARLRPLTSDQRIEPIQTGLVGHSYVPSRIAATSVGRMTSDPPRRTIGQSGMMAKDLTPNSPSVHGQTLPPNGNGGVGIASLPVLPFFR